MDFVSLKPWSVSFVVSVEVVLPRSLSEPMIQDITALGRDPTLLQVNDVAKSSKTLTLLASVTLVAIDPFAVSRRSLGGSKWEDKDEP